MISQQKIQAKTKYLFYLESRERRSRKYRALVPTSMRAMKCRKPWEVCPLQLLLRPSPV